MIKLSDLFIKNLPTLDLHGTTRDVATILTKDFINDSYYLEHNKIIIIHGIGGGVIKEAVHFELKKNNHVTTYYINPYNSGVTIINIKQKKVDKKQNIC